MHPRWFPCVNLGKWSHSKISHKQRKHIAGNYQRNALKHAWVQRKSKKQTPESAPMDSHAKHTNSGKLYMPLIFRAESYQPPGRSAPFRVSEGRVIVSRYKSCVSKAMLASPLPGWQVDALATTYPKLKCWRCYLPTKHRPRHLPWSIYS